MFALIAYAFYDNVCLLIAYAFYDSRCLLIADNHLIFVLGFFVVFEKTD